MPEIFVKEHLTKTRSTLLYDVRSFARVNNVKYAHLSDGKSFICDNSDRRHLVKTDTDVLKHGDHVEPKRELSPGSRPERTGRAVALNSYFVRVTGHPSLDMRFLTLYKQYKYRESHGACGPLLGEKGIICICAQINTDDRVTQIICKISILIGFHIQNKRSSCFCGGVLHYIYQKNKHQYCHRSPQRISFSASHNYLSYHVSSEHTVA